MKDKIKEKVLKIPKDFVKKFLRAKGWKTLHSVRCDCELKIISFPKHPIRYLWKHILKGHEPSFDCCHGWDRQIGRDTGEFEEWYKWWTFGWNKKLNNFEVIESYQGIDGFETDVTSQEQRGFNTRIGRLK